MVKEVNQLDYTNLPPKAHFGVSILGIMSFISEVFQVPVLIAAVVLKLSHAKSPDASQFTLTELLLVALPTFAAFILGAISIWRKGISFGNALGTIGFSISVTLLLVLLIVMF